MVGTSNLGSWSGHWILTFYCPSNQKPMTSKNMGGIFTVVFTRTSDVIWLWSGTMDQLCLGKSRSVAGSPFTAPCCVFCCSPWPRWWPLATVSDAEPFHRGDAASPQSTGRWKSVVETMVQVGCVYYCLFIVYTHTYIYNIMYKIRKNDNDGKSKLIYPPYTPYIHIYNV